MIKRANALQRRAVAHQSARLLAAVASLKVMPRNTSESRVHGVEKKKQGSSDRFSRSGCHWNGRFLPTIKVADAVGDPVKRLSAEPQVHFVRDCSHASIGALMPQDCGEICQLRKLATRVV
jgi:hypothetical protein